MFASVVMLSQMVSIDLHIAFAVNMRYVVHVSDEFCNDKPPGVINASGGWVLLAAALLPFELDVPSLQMNN